MTSDYATILHVAPGGRACKRWSWTGRSWLSDDYELGYLATSYTVPLGDLAELHHLLDYLQDQPERCILRGAALDPAHARDVLHRRLSQAAPVDRRQPDGPTEGPYYREVDHRWLMVDVDSGVLPADPWAIVDGRPRAVWAALELLPEAFRTAGVIWQWSNSAGFKHELKVHLWFWGNRPVCDRSLRAWNQRHDLGLDASVWRAVQPHYTSNPIISGGPDPLPCPRVGWSEGPELKLPGEVLSLRNQERQDAAEERERLARIKSARNRWRLLKDKAQRSGDRRQRRISAYADKAMASAVEKILGAGVGGRHDTICSESYTTAGLVVGGHLEEALWREALMDAGLAAVGEPRRREVEDLLNSALERAQPRDLSHVGLEVPR